MAQTHDAYYVPHGSHWPIVGSIGLFSTAIGAANWMNGGTGVTTSPLFFLGLAIIAFMMFGWFGTVIRESVAGNYNKQVDVSFRMGMMWFIFSEIMFFGAFFGALFYARMYSVPWIGGEGHGALTNYFLWQDYTPSWPTNGPGNIGGTFETIPAWHLPLYMEAYQHLNLTLGSGIYGSTFFMLTGFHGAHVTLGTIMLTVMWFRCAKGHFTKDDHFGFEAVAWYWHFVDVVWLGLFVFVYVL